MAIVQKQVAYAQEIGDVGVALETLLGDIMAKKPIAVIAADSFQKLVAAVEGVDQVGAELAADRVTCMHTMGYHVGGLVEALLPKPAAPVVPAPAEA